MKENYFPGRETVIKKMTQKFSLDPETPAESQIKKTEFNLNKKQVYIYYHYKEGKITAGYDEFPRDELIGNNKLSDINDGEKEETQRQQTLARILEMEQRCHEQIKDYERGTRAEKEQHEELERKIH